MSIQYTDHSILRHRTSLPENIAQLVSINDITQLEHSMATIFIEQINAICPFVYTLIYLQIFINAVYIVIIVDLIVLSVFMITCRPVVNCIFNDFSLVGYENS